MAKAGRDDDEIFPRQLYVMRDGDRDGTAFFHGESDLRQLDAVDGDLVAVYLRADIQVMNIRRTLEPRGRRLPPVKTPPVKKQ